ncbi:MAG: reactive intermediate/imine deaminase [Gammaproteobacteria bacterium RIFCSPHIGHO2_12_FULL_45_12]|nr:MAG: reactive intermediate/imine deaminase [Gammaproteobacteria bacterium RIFCSPHIGHO2_12_FULL_45_12]
MKKQSIHTDNAPLAIGPYSQAVRVGETVYFSGQIALDPKTMALVAGDIEAQTRQVFENLQAVSEAAGGSLSDIVKLTLYLIDLSHFSRVNAVMETFFSKPYPARVTLQVAALPKAALIEIEAVMAG